MLTLNFAARKWSCGGRHTANRFVTSPRGHEVAKQLISHRGQSGAKPKQKSADRSTETSGACLSVNDVQEASGATSDFVLKRIASQRTRNASWLENNTSEQAELFCVHGNAIVQCLATF